MRHNIAPFNQITINTASVRPVVSIFDDDPRINVVLDDLHVGLLAEIRLADIEMPVYQRATNLERVQKIAEEFDPVSLGLLTLSYRAGKFYLAEGAHRYLAMLKRDMDLWTFKVLTGLTEDDEIRIFKEQDKNKRLIGSFDEFSSGLLIKDAVCVLIEDITKQYGFNIVRCKNTFNQISSVDGLISIVTKYSGFVLGETLRALRAACADVEGMSNRPSLIGTAEFISRFGSEKFIKRISSRKAMQAQMRYIQDKSGGYAGSAFCRALVAVYNDGLRPDSKERVVLA